MLLPEEVAEAATKGELQKVVKWLRKGGHVDARGEQEGARFTLLHWAATFGHVSLAKEVLKRRADVNLLSSGCTPLMTAAFALPPEQDMAGVPASVPGRLGVLRLLLQQNAAVNFQNDSNYTALMSAAEDGNDACIAILLEAGADTSLRENEGRNALEIAKANHHDSTAQMLLQHMLLQHTAAHSPAAAVENAEAATGAAAAEIAAGMGVAEPQPNETPAQPTPPALELERVLEVTRAMNLTDAETASLSEAMEAPGEGPSASDARAKLNHVDMQKPEARGCCGAGSSGAMSVKEFLKLPAFGTRSTASDGGKGLNVGGRAPRGPVTDNQAWAAMALETLPSSMLYPDGDDQPMPAGKKGTKKSLTVTALELAKVLPPDSLASVLQIVVELAAISQLEEYELDDWAPAVQVVQAAGGRLRRLLRGTHDELLMQFIDTCPEPLRPHLLEAPPPFPFPPDVPAESIVLYQPPMGEDPAVKLTPIDLTTAPDTAPGRLTAGAVQALSRATNGGAKPNITPTLQLLYLQSEFDRKRSRNVNRIIFSDGRHLMQAVLAERLGRMLSPEQARDGPSPPAAAHGHSTAPPPTHPKPSSCAWLGAVHSTTQTRHGAGCRGSFQSGPSFGWMRSSAQRRGDRTRTPARSSCSASPSSRPATRSSAALPRSWPPPSVSPSSSARPSARG